MGRAGTSVVTKATARDGSGRARAPLLMALLIVGLSRLPFVTPGYGVDPDAWRIADAGREIAATGAYVVSRFPGYPVCELASAVLPKQAWVVCAVTALMSVAAAAFFMLTLRHVGCPDYVLGGIALAFSPVVYVASVNGMDHVWALAFLMAGLYFLVNQHTLLAGCCIGMAIGCRPSSAAALLPYCIIIAKDQAVGRRLRSALSLIVPAVLVGGLFFLPVIARYGSACLTVYEHGYPSLFQVAALGTIHVWGELGALAVAIAVCWTAWRWRAGSVPFYEAKRACRGVTAGATAAVVVYLALFLRFPHDASYLIPALPFTLLLGSPLMRRTSFRAVCIAIAISPFAFSLGKAGLQPGRILRDHTERVRDVSYSRAVVRIAERLPEGSVVVAGSHEPKLRVLSEAIHYVYLLEPGEGKVYIARGRPIYYLPHVVEFNNSVNGVRLDETGTPLPEPR